MPKEKRKVLYPVSIPGLELFGYNVFNEAQPPMETHNHQDCVEIVMVTRGCEYYAVEDTVYAVSGGQAFLSLCNEFHKSGLNCQHVCEFYWFILNLTYTENFLGFSPEYARRLIDRLSQQKNRVMDISEECMALAKKTFALFCREEDAVYAASSFHLLITKLLYDLPAHPCRTDDVDAIMAYIQKHVYETIDLSDMSEEMGWSLPVIHAKFKKHTGYTLRKYINFQKIEIAKQLLSGGKSVTETAMELGFNTSDYFSTVFKKFTSVSPSQYARTAKVPHHSANNPE